MWPGLGASEGAAHSARALARVLDQHWGLANSLQMQQRQLGGTKGSCTGSLQR